MGVQLTENIELKHWNRKFIKYKESLNFDQQEIKQTLKQHLRQLKTLREQITEVVRILRKMINLDEEKQKIITRLITVPGIRFITAVRLYTKIMDIRRFRGFDHLSSYVGLTPSTYSSGQREVVLVITQIQSRYLRNILI